MKLTPHYTPGPWINDGLRKWHHPVTGAPQLFERIACPVGDIELADFTNESGANLDLICAAPDLAAALLECVTDPESYNANNAAALCRRITAINALAREALKKAGLTKEGP